MKLFVFIILLFTPFGRLDVVEVRGPANPDSTAWTVNECMEAREDFMARGPEQLASFDAKAWRRIVTPCIELDAHNLPYCQ